MTDGVILSFVLLTVAVVVSYLFIVPLLVLIHELGHAVPALIFTDDDVIVTLGSISDTRYKQIRLGRLIMNLSPFSGWTGFCHFKGEMSKGQSLTYYLGGPTVTLIVLLTTYLSSMFFRGTWINFALLGITYGTGLQLVATIVPVRYPSWWGAYGRDASDGYRVLKIIGGR